MRQILKCIRTIDKLDVELFNELNIGVEIQDFTEPNLTDEKKQEIVGAYKSALENLKGRRALHGPFLDLKPASPDNLIRMVSYKRYLDTINIATELDIDYLIFHSQINPNLNEPNLVKLNNYQARDFWQSILKETNFKGTILIENIFENEPKTLLDYIDMVDFPNIKVNLDIGHAKLGKARLEDWIKLLKYKIVYIHIHSNNGKYDQHLAPKETEIRDLYNLLDKYDIDPVLSLEYEINDFKKEITKYL